MTAPVAERLEQPGYDELWRVPCAGSVAYVAIHALVGGRAFGGIRIRRYGDETEARNDALSLSRAMSRKLALAELRGGGAKAVLIKPTAGDRRAAVAALGAFVQWLDGRYCCGPDLGFRADDDVVLRQTTSHVAPPGMSASTARTVEASLRAACPDPRRVAVQGLGTVGRPLADSLMAAGVDVVAADLRPVTDVPSVDIGQIHQEPVDVFAPCAAGGVLDAHSVPQLACRVVCGGANDPLADADAGRALHERGIVFVPDVISNSGAAIVGASTALGEAAQIESRLTSVGPRVAALLQAAHAADRLPEEQAVWQADEILRDRRGS
jgi:leucine dehydrogenase